MAGGEENERQRILSTEGEKRVRERELGRDPMLDAVDCSECGKEFIPTKPKQSTCGRPSCNGGKGARTRDYKTKKLPGGKKAAR